MTAQNRAKAAGDNLSIIMAEVTLLWSDLVEMEECREEWQWRFPQDEWDAIVEEKEWRFKQDEWDAIVEEREERMEEWQSLVADYFSLRKVEEKETLQEWQNKADEWEAIVEEKEEIMEEWESAVANFFSLM